MIKLTDKEKELFELILKDADSSECAIIGADITLCPDGVIGTKNHIKLGWSFDTLKGVLGSLINKNIIEYSDHYSSDIQDNGYGNKNGYGIEAYEWNYNVQKKREEDDVRLDQWSVDKYLKAMQEERA